MKVNVLVEETWFDQKHHPSESVTGEKDQSHLLLCYYQQCCSSVGHNIKNEKISQHGNTRDKSDAYSRFLCFFLGGG